MSNTKTDRDFLFALDYILNKANLREIEAFAAAVERRQAQLEGAINGSIPFTPEEAAKKMSESIYASIDASMDGVRHTFRDYAADILQKEADKLPDWWWDETAYRRDVLFYLPEVDREKIKAETLSWIDEKEHLHFGETAFFYSNHNQADYLRSNYHKKLIGSAFYKSLTIRNGRTFQKIIELANQA